MLSSGGQSLIKDAPSKSFYCRSEPTCSWHLPWWMRSPLKVEQGPGPDSPCFLVRTQVRNGIRVEDFNAGSQPDHSQSYLPCSRGLRHSGELLEPYAFFTAVSFKNYHPPGLGGRWRGEWLRDQPVCCFLLWPLHPGWSYATTRLIGLVPHQGDGVSSDRLQGSVGKENHMMWKPQPNSLLYLAI